MLPHVRRPKALGWFAASLLLGAVAAHGCSAAPGHPAHAANRPGGQDAAADDGERAPGAAAGRIRCGSATCSAQTQVCCADANGNGLRCESRSADPNQPECKDDELAKYCDDRSDCGHDAVCCRTYDCSGGCPPKLECERSRCEVEMAEACLGPGGCSAEFECRISADSEHGYCALARPGVDCGAARCAGDRPVCRWDGAARGGTCIAGVPQELGEPNDDVAYLACASAKDCAGYTCGKMADMPYRVYQCAAPGFAGDRFSPILCARIEDCPKHWGREATGCEPAPDGVAPAFLRVCAYPEPD